MKVHTANNREKDSFGECLLRQEGLDAPTRHLVFINKDAYSKI